MVFIKNNIREIKRMIICITETLAVEVTWHGKNDLDLTYNHKLRITKN